MSYVNNRDQHTIIFVDVCVCASYETSTLLELGVSPCQTHVTVRHPMALARYLWQVSQFFSNVSTHLRNFSTCNFYHWLQFPCFLREHNRRLWKMSNIKLLLTCRLLSSVLHQRENHQQGLNHAHYLALRILNKLFKWCH